MRMKKYSQKGKNTKNMEKRKYFFVCLFLFFSLFLTYSQIRNHEFINYDDDVYIVENHHIQEGISLSGIKWAFTTFKNSNWHPLTWLSHMLDYELFGLNPTGHHFMNVFFHAISSILLFFSLIMMFSVSKNKFSADCFWISVFIASLFALHPMHVESVAWAAERKDVLCTMFWMLTMIAYMFYIKRPDIRRYIPVLIFFVLGLLSKPMIVTLPFVLILTDIWPFKRFKLKKRDIKIFTEKIPLFILVVFSSVITFMAQSKGGAVTSINHLSFLTRFLNAVHSYFQYLIKFCWPSQLSVFYPYAAPSTGQLILSFSGIALISFLTIRSFKKRPWYLIGWLWYLGTLIPVIGIVQVGTQSMADRYTYIPFIGIAIIIALGLTELFAFLKLKKNHLICFFVMLIFIFSICTWFQIRHWKNSFTIYEQAISVTKANHLAHNNLGAAYSAKLNHESAIYHFRKALEYKPEYPVALDNLGSELSEKGEYKIAISLFKKAIQLKPDFSKAYYNSGTTLILLNRYEEAYDYLKKTIELDPEYIEAYINISKILLKQGKFNEAIFYLKEIIRKDPSNVDATYNLGALYLKTGNLKEAVTYLERSVILQEDLEMAYFLLVRIYLRLNNKDSAQKHYKTLTELNQKLADRFKEQFSTSLF